MECNKDEAARAKALAERKMLEKDFVGARRMILKAQRLSAEVDNVSQLLTVCDVHCAAATKVNGEIDWYGVLQLPMTADGTLIKKQYRKLSLLLHPDKNQFAGAEAAFKLVGEANVTLTDCSKRSAYDMRRNASVIVPSAGPPPYQQPGRTAHARPPTIPVYDMHQQQQHQASNSSESLMFWTICSSCGARYLFYLSFLNRVMQCHNCLKSFIAQDLNEQYVPYGANQQSAGVWGNIGASQNFSAPQANVTCQQAWSCFSSPQTNVAGQHAWNYYSGLQPSFTGQHAWNYYSGPQASDAGQQARNSATPGCQVSRSYGRRRKKRYQKRRLRERKA